MGKRKDSLEWMVECKFPDDAPEWIVGTDLGWGPYMGPMRSKNDCIAQCRFELVQYPPERWEGRTEFRAAGYEDGKLIKLVNFKKPKMPPLGSLALSAGYATPAPQRWRELGH